MFAFIDESGQPHPNDDSSRPVVVSVCIAQQDARLVAGQLYGLKRRLGTPNIELKGVNLINRRVFQRRSNEWELVESFFDLCRSLPFVMFAIVMERPQRPPDGITPGNEVYLPNQYRYLLQRINQLAEQRNRMATILFDGEGSTIYDSLAQRFESFLYRSVEGQSFQAISDAPFFVDSKITHGIQIADLVASVIRIYQENKLFVVVPQADGFLSAINRYYGIVNSKTVGLMSPDGYVRPGIYFMPERDYYRRVPEQGELEGLNAEPGG